MLKSKGAIIGIAAALVAGAMLFAGLTMTATTGAATDVVVGWPSGLPDPSDQPAAPNPGNPPASDTEQPGAGSGAAPTQPGPGNQAGAGAGTTLPNAGNGVPSDGNALGTFVVLMGIAGAVLVSIGAKAASDRKN